MSGSLSEAWLTELIEDPAPEPADLAQASGINPRVLDEVADRVAHLKVADRLAAWTSERAYAAIAAVTDVGDVGNWSQARSLSDEISVARRVASASADPAISVALTLDQTPSVADALSAGWISEAHARVFESETANLDPGEARNLIVEVARQVLPKGRRQTPGQFRKSVTAAVQAVDPQGQADHFANARDSRYVSARQTFDGMGELHATHEWPVINAMMGVLDRAARRLQLERGGAPSAAANPDSLLSACRADALAAAVRHLPDIPPVVHRGQLVIDLDTLRREADNPCLLDGAPIPAQVGRALAVGIDWWRRLVTDPVDGHLLDFGRESYLPSPLRSFVAARDGHCGHPYCERPARRCDLDHHTPYPHGPSSAANTGLLCQMHHDLKTGRLADVTDSGADGSMTWHTASGQQVSRPPRHVLPDPPDPDPPPF